MTTIFFWLSEHPALMIAIAAIGSVWLFVLALCVSASVADDALEDEHD